MSSPDQLRAPLLWLLLPLGVGLIAANRWPAPANNLALPATVALVGSIVALFAGKRDRSRWANTGLVVSVAFSGFCLLHLRYPHLHEWSERPPRETTLAITISHEFSAAPDARSFGGLARVADHPHNAPELRQRHVYYSASRRGSIPVDRTGTYLVQGVLEPLRRTERSGFEDYLANAGIRYCLVRARVLKEIEAPNGFATFCSRSQRKLQGILRTGLADHPMERSLYLGMTLGEKAVLSPAQENAFVRSGTFHVFSISGLHVAVISFALHCLLRFLRVPRQAGVVLSLTFLWLYVQITGASSPAIRAFLMIAFVLVQFSCRLPGNFFAALVGAALATLLLDPIQLFSTGFQMSYSVMVALILMGGPLGQMGLARWKPFALLPSRNWRWWHHACNKAGATAVLGFAGGWAAFLASAPAGIGFFGLLSTGSLFANLLVIPLSSLVIQAGFVSLVFGLCGLTFLSALFNRFAALIISLMDRVLQGSADFPGMAFEAQFRVAWVTPLALVLMGAVILLCATGKWVRARGGFWPPSILLGLMLLLAVRFGAPAPGEKISVNSRATAATVRPMKSAYELAMERLAKADPTNAPLSAEKKARLADIDRVFQGKIAEREIFLKQQLQGALASQNLEEADKIRQQIANEKARLEEEREEEKERVRRAKG